MSDDPRLNLVLTTTEEIDRLLDRVQQLRATRAKAVWGMVNDRVETIASVARKCDQSEIRLRKSVETYRDGVPAFRRKPSQ